MPKKKRRAGGIAKHRERAAKMAEGDTPGELPGDYSRADLFDLINAVGALMPSMRKELAKAVEKLKTAETVGLVLDGEVVGEVTLVGELDDDEDDEEDDEEDLEDWNEKYPL